MHTFSSEKLTYVIAHNGFDIIHPTIVEPGVTLSTGQANLEEFDNKEEWETRLTELGYDVTTLVQPPALLGLKPGERPTPEQLEQLRQEAMRSAPVIDVTPEPVVTENQAP